MGTFVAQTAKREPLLATFCMTRNMGTVLFPEHQRQTYTQEAFSALCETFGIPADVHDELRQSLEDCAAIWRRFRLAEEPRPPAHHVRQELKTLAKQAAKLTASYDALSDDARRALTMMQEQHAMRGVPQALTMASPPYPYLHMPSGASFNEALLAELSDIARLVEGLRAVAEDASDWVTPQKAGTRRSEALRMWMANAHLIWTRLLGRPFTRDSLSNGEPISEAARFCVAAFAPVDPDTPKTRIDHEMRQLISRLRSAT